MVSMVEMVITVEMIIMVEMVILVEMVSMVEIGQTSQRQTGQIDLTFKLDFPGNLCRAAFAIFAMFCVFIANTVLIYGVKFLAWISVGVKFWTNIMSVY